VCPSRILADHPEAEALVAWWVESSPWDPWMDGPAGPPEWPRPGGLMRQAAKLVEAVRILRNEWPKLRPKGKDRKRKDEQGSDDA